MELFQILDCSSLGTCCKDYGLVSILDITRRIFDFIQLIVPIILIIMMVIQFVHLSINPELKDGFRRILNKFIATVIIFVLPILIDAVLGLMPNTFTVSACWEEAKSMGVDIFSSHRYVEIEDDDSHTIWINTPQYAAKRDARRNTSTNGVGTGTGEGSAQGRAIVAYASKYIGKPYRYGGVWNGEDPYTPTDCSGFVSGVYRHFGYDLYPQTEIMWSQTSKYTLVSSGNIKAGDLVMYQGHVAMLTGNGNEIIHAKCTKCGIVKDSDYSRSSSFKGIMRINGVN